MTERLRAFAQPQRLMVLALLLEGERAVGEIEELTGIGQPALSQQLAELRRSGLATTRREARMVYYSISEGDAQDRVRAAFAAFEATPPAMRRPISALLRRPNSAGPNGSAWFARIG